MSAFLLNKKGLALLADGLSEIINHNKVQGVEVSAPELAELIKGKDKKEIFRMLNFLNAQALYYRYGDTVQQNLYDTCEEISSEYSKEQFLKSLHCFQYQCTEGVIPETSYLYQLLEKLKHDLDNKIDTKSDAYIMAKWDYPRY